MHQYFIVVESIRLVMNKIVIKLIKWYQKIPGDFHNHCKYIPSCSNYAILAYQRFNFFKATYLMIKRILKCNPFSKGGIDLVPERKIKYEKN